MLSFVADSKEYSSEGSRGVVYDSDSPGMKELFEDNFSPGKIFTCKLLQNLIINRV